jgi:uncharacterized protein YcfL
MKNQQKYLAKKAKLSILLVVSMVLFLGCSSNKAVDVKPSDIKRITDITISKDSESLIFTINGNQTLTYTALNQVFPLGILFHFPDTILDVAQRVYVPPQNEIISIIKAGEIIEDKATTSRIFIALKREAPYDLTPHDSGLRVAFKRTTVISDDTKAPDDTKPLKKLAEKKSEPRPIQESLPAATRLKAVTATPLKDNVAVDVKADGAIKNYRSFTINNPARVVFDMYDLKSPYYKEQIIAVDSKWVKRIRYFAHPDKVRLVLETYDDFLAKYSALPTDSGLLIHVGNIPTAAKKASQTVSDDDLGDKQVTLAWDNVPDATSYNVYWSDSPGVTKRTGNKISNAKNSVTITGLKPGVTYYFMVTTVRGSQESAGSEELSFTTSE